MTTAENRAVVLKREIFLQVNQRLYEEGLIPETLYEEAKIRIVSGT